MNMNLPFQYKIDDEWYTTKEDVQFFVDKAKISTKNVIWCPFDLPSSNFVTILKKNGYKVINSHIKTHQNFYKYQPKQHWDIIISNPPFRNKHNILKRLLEFGCKKNGL